MEKTWQIRLWCNSQKEEIMKTLKEVACGQTVKVKKDQEVLVALYMDR